MIRRGEQHTVARTAAQQLVDVVQRAAHGVGDVDRAFAAGARYVAQPGGSARDEEVIAACDEHGMAMAFTAVRLFHH